MHGREDEGDPSPRTIRNLLGSLSATGNQVLAFCCRAAPAPTTCILCVALLFPKYLVGFGVLLSIRFFLSICPSCFPLTYTAVRENYENIQPYITQSHSTGICIFFLAICNCRTRQRYALPCCYPGDTLMLAFMAMLKLRCWRSVSGLMLE